MGDRSSRAAGVAALQIRDVVVDCADHDVVVAFWSAALGWIARRVNRQYVSLDPPPGEAGPAILFQLVPERKTVKNRVHLDFATPEMATEVARLVGLGATVLAERSLGTFRWTVLADPEGNEFCVLSRTSDE
jgi:predicted enzyme related to lactoylglutathione lyase